MTTRKELICVCDVCNHRWIPESWQQAKPRGLELPKRCAKCKSVLWNRDPMKRGPKPMKGSKRA